MQQNKNDLCFEKEIRSDWEKQSYYGLDNQSEKKTEIKNQEQDNKESQIFVDQFELQCRQLEKISQKTQYKRNELSKTKLKKVERWKTYCNQDEQNHQNNENKKSKKQNKEYSPQSEVKNDENDSKFKTIRIIDNDSRYKKQIKISKLSNYIQQQQQDQKLSPNEIEQIKREETITIQFTDFSIKQEPLENLKFKEIQPQNQYVERLNMVNNEKKSLQQKNNQQNINFIIKQQGQQTQRKQELTQTGNVKEMWRNIYLPPIDNKIYKNPQQNQQMDQKYQNIKHLPLLNQKYKNQPLTPSINKINELKDIYQSKPQLLKRVQNYKFQQGKQQKLILPKINNHKK